MSSLESRSRIVAEVCLECDWQDKKWGSQRQLQPRTWIGILGEEFGEVCHAVNEKDLVSYRAELIQCAAVVLQAIDALDRQTNP